MKRLFLAAAALLVAGPAAAADIVVTQKGKQFTPDAVTAKVGDTLVFRNNDNISHNTHATDKNYRFNLGLQNPDGDDLKLDLEKSGTFTVRCAIHPKMKMNVTVTD